MENALQITETHGIERANQTSSAVATAARTRVIEVRPSLDVFENGEAIRIVADVPGVDAAHADIRVEMPHLRIACTRPAAREATIRYAATLTLPPTIDAESLSAQLRDGVLEISMQKSARARARRIEVRHG
jgi:HSP20 family molecular chaperone IbpA